MKTRVSFVIASPEEAKQSRKPFEKHCCCWIASSLVQLDISNAIGHTLFTMTDRTTVLRDSETAIRTRSCPCCYLCGSRGISLYEGLKDRLFGAPGIWNLKKCPSPDCGLIWLDPMPTEEDIGKAYENYYTHREDPTGSTHRKRKFLKRLKSNYRKIRTDGYLAVKYGYRRKSVGVLERAVGMLVYLNPGRRAKLDFAIMYLPSHQGGRFLEVGCGNGRKAKFMQEIGWEVEGVDLDQVAVESARKSGLCIHHGSLEMQRYPADSFDAIVMIHLIEHVHNPLRLLSECNRILKQNGHLVVVTPNTKSFEHKLFRSNWLHLDPPRHLILFNMTPLRRLVRKAGFSAIEVATTIRDANGVFEASHAIRRNGHYEWGRRQPRHIRVWARAMQLIESVLLGLNPELGEEIALIARKPTAGR